MQWKLWQHLAQWKKSFELPIKGSKWVQTQGQPFFVCLVGFFSARLPWWLCAPRRCVPISDLGKAASSRLLYRSVVTHLTKSSEFCSGFGTHVWAREENWIKCTNRVLENNRDTLLHSSAHKQFAPGPLQWRQTKETRLPDFPAWWIFCMGKSFTFLKELQKSPPLKAIGPLMR